MSTPAHRSAALLAIGDEVLRGEIINSNAAFLSDAAVRAGVRRARAPGGLRRRRRHPGGAGAACAAEVDVVIVTGGLGPTDDDRTVDVVSALLGAAPVTHEPLAATR